MSDAEDFSVIRTVFFYSVLILLLPIAAFFTTKVVFFDVLLGASNVTSNVWSAVVAVVVLHIALGLFIYRAYAVPTKLRQDKDDKVD